MSATQKQQIFELLNRRLGQPETAWQLMAAIEAVLDDTVGEKTAEFEGSFSQRMEALRQEMRTTFATKQAFAKGLGSLDTKISEVKAEILRWMVMLFFPFYVGMIVFLIKQFV